MSVLSKDSFTFLVGLFKDNLFNQWLDIHLGGEDARGSLEYSSHEISERFSWTLNNFCKVAGRVAWIGRLSPRPLGTVGDLSIHLSGELGLIGLVRPPPQKHIGVPRGVAILSIVVRLIMAALRVHRLPHKEAAWAQASASQLSPVARRQDRLAD